MRLRPRLTRPARKYLWTALGIAAIAVIVALVAGPQRPPDRLSAGSRPQDVPPDLAPFREPFLEGMEALQNGDSSRAIELLDAMTFGSRKVEQYRLYYLATAHQLADHPNRGRRALATMWRGAPELVYWQDSGFTLASLYASSGDFASAARIYRDIAERSEHPAVAATARQEAVRAMFYAGNPAGAWMAAREIAIESPRTPEVRSAIQLVAALSNPPGRQLSLASDERLHRARSLIRDGDSKSALAELDNIQQASVSLRNEVALQRGLALHRLKQYEESNAQLEPLTSGAFRYAIPALDTAAKNYAAMAAAIDPVRYKTVVEKKKTGTRKVRRKTKKGTRTVTEAVYRNVSRRVELIDLEDKKKKEEYENLRIERLQDLLLLKTTPELRKQTLHTLVAVATEKNQNDYIQELVTQLVAVDPRDDTALQRFWDQGWAAYLDGDHETARARFRFIDRTYINPNIKRQARYWFARSMEKSGGKEEAQKIYQELVGAPYVDLYAKFSESRGAKRPAGPIRDPETETREWGEIADTEMPAELQLAYELNALGLPREARLEIQNNVNETNRHYADAVLADMYYNAGSFDLAAVMMKRAFPAIATVEQDRVPRYFMEMYYPRQYQEQILEQAKARDVDPYLVMGLILQESRYNPEARSRVGATGLMQIMPPTGKELATKINRLFTERRLTDPAYNIELGTFYLRHLINIFDGVDELAIAAYNGGQGNVRKWRRSNQRPLDEFIESIPFSETRNYVKRVTLLRGTYRELSSRVEMTSASAKPSRSPGVQRAKAEPQE